MEKVSEGAVIREAGSSKKNKTGSWRTFRPIPTDKCSGCAICVSYCPDSAITVNPKTKKAVINYDYCKGCLICVQECPNKAIKTEKERD